MKIILKSKVKNLGNIGDVVDVKDGYAKNMLLPSGLAVFYTDKNYDGFKLKKAEIEKDNEENRVKAEKLKEKIAGKDLVLIENAGDDGKLYGSVSGVKLANFINMVLKINDLKKSCIFLREPIKNVGKYSITIDLHPEVSIDKDIIIARTKEEAIKIKKGEFIIKKEEVIASPTNPSEIVVVGEKTEEVANEPKKEKKKVKKEKIEEKEIKENKEENKEVEKA
jgi:large subunit ribosomal protein L9